MDETPKKIPTLPPNYVSLAHLRDKWLLKQQQQIQIQTNQNAAHQTDDETQLNGVENKKKNNKKWRKKTNKQPLVVEKVEDNQNDEFYCEIDNNNESKRFPKNPIGVQHNNGDASNGTKVYRVKLVDETKDHNGYRKRGNRKRVNESSQGDEKSKKLEEMSKSEVLEVCMRVEGLEVKETDGFYKEDDIFLGVGLNDDKLVGNGAKDDEKVEPRNDFGRRWWSGNDGRKFGGHRRLGKRKGVGGNKLERSGVESSKGDEKGKGSDEMSKSETIEVGVKLEGLKVKDGNRRKADGVVGGGLNDEQIVGNETRAKNDDKGEAGLEFGKNKNGSGNVERTLGGPAFGNRRLGNKKTVSGNRSEKILAELKDESKKSDKKEQDLDVMSKSEVLEVGVKLDGLKVIDRNAKDDSVVGVGLNGDQIAENGKGEAGNEFGKYRNRNGSGNIERTLGRPAFGNRRLGNKKTVGGNSSEKIVAELKDESKKSDEKEQDLDGMSMSDVLEVGVKLDGLKVIDRNAKDDSVVGVGLNGDQIAENGKGEAGNEFGKYRNRNRNGNVERKYGRAGDRRLGNAVGNRNSGGTGRLGGGRMNQRDNDMVWVKKEEKSSANAAQVGFTGI